MLLFLWLEGWGSELDDNYVPSLCYSMKWDMVYLGQLSWHKLEENMRYVKSLEDALIHQLLSLNIKFHKNGSTIKIPGNISLSFEGLSGESLLHRLDLLGICVSTGSACDSKTTQISHVLKAIGLEESLAKGTIRISLGKYNTIDDVNRIVEALVRIVK